MRIPRKRMPRPAQSYAMNELCSRQDQLRDLAAEWGMRVNVYGAQSMANFVRDLGAFGCAGLQTYLIQNRQSDLADTLIETLREVRGSEKDES